MKSLKRKSRPPSRRVQPTKRRRTTRKAKKSEERAERERKGEEKGRTAESLFFVKSLAILYKYFKHFKKTGEENGKNRKKKRPEGVYFRLKKAKKEHENVIAGHSSLKFSFGENVDEIPREVHKK